MATLKDPHGSVIVRRYGKVVARLKGGEHFLVEPMDGGGWNVYLKSGCDGFIEKADLQLLPDEPLMKLNYVGKRSCGKNGNRPRPRETRKRLRPKNAALTIMQF